MTAESGAKGPGRQKAEQGQWFRLHGHSKTGHDAAIVRLSTALLDADVRRSMYKHPWLSHDKYRGESQNMHNIPTALKNSCSHGLFSIMPAASQACFC